MCIVIVGFVGVVAGLAASQRKRWPLEPKDLYSACVSKMKRLMPSDSLLTNKQYMAKLLTTRKRFQGRMKIYLITYQVVTSLPFVLEFRFPDSYASVLSLFRVLTLSVTQGSVTNCAPVKLDYIDFLLIDTLYPLVLLLVLFVMCALHRAYMRCNGSARDAEAKVESYYLAIAVAFTYVILPGTSTSIFRTYPCQNVDPDDSDSGDNWFMRSDYSISCSSDRYYFGVSWATAMIIVYPVAIPIAYFCLLRRNKSLILSRKTVTGPPDEDARTNCLRPLLILCDIYAPHRWYFEIIETCYRVFLTGVLALIRPGSANQIIVGALVTLLFIKLYNTSKSFNDRYIGALKEVSMWQVFAVLFVTLMVRTEVIGASSGAAVAMFHCAFFWNIMYEVMRYVCSAGISRHFAAASMEGGCDCQLHDEENSLSADALVQRIGQTKTHLNILKSRLHQLQHVGPQGVSADEEESAGGNSLVLSPLSSSSENDKVRNIDQ